MTKPDELVEKVAADFVNNYNKMFPERSRGEFKDLPQEQKDGLLKQARSAIKVVLSEIQKGDVVESDGNDYFQLKPEYQRFIEDVK